MQIKIIIAYVIVVATATSAQAQVIEGFTEPIETVEVAAATTGIIQVIHKSQGAALRQGDAICALDTRELEATLAVARARAAAKGELQSAEAVLESKQRRLAKLEALVDKGHASAEEIERAKLDVALATASVTSAKEEQLLHELEAKRIEAQIEQRTVRSPLDGEIVKLQRSVGEFVTPTDAVVATIVNLTSLRVKFFVPTKTAMRWSVDQEVSVRIPDINHSTVARIQFISPVTDSKSGTVRVEVLIDNPEQRHRSGLRCLLDPTAVLARASQ